LLRRGANASIHDSDSASAAMWACRLDSVDHFNLLMRGSLGAPGSDWERDSQGRTAVHWAVRRQEPLLCLRALLCPDPVDPAAAAAAAASAELRDNCGRTPLLAAAEIGAMAACKLILESCSRSVLEQMDISSRTAVHLATLGGHGEVLNYLLDQGAEIDARDGEGATAWDYAKQRRLYYCKLILASHYRQKLCSSSAGPDVGDAPAGRQSVEFAVPRPPRTPPTPRSKSPSSSGRRRLIPAGGAAAVSRESSLENGELPIQLAPVAEAAQTSSARAEPEPEPEVTAEIEADASAVVAARPVEGRRASEPTAAVERRERTTRNSAEHPDPQRLHPRPPLGSPDRRLIRGAQPPYKLPHRPSQSGAAAAEKETDDEAEESESTLPPPPPEFQTSVEEQVASGDDEGDKEPPLDTERMQRVAVQPKPQERHRHNPPPVSVESQTAPAQLMPLPIAYTEAASAAAPSAGSRRRLTGKKKKRRPADAGVSGGALSARDYSIRAAAAGFVQPLVENVINSVTLQQRVPPMASPRSASASAISGGQTLMVSSADAGNRTAASGALSGVGKLR
ncbi:hypothetical protein BOX15_Mlig005256g2, partial [Macrostomum lignano]